MAISIFPTPVTTVSGVSANAYTVAAADTLYVSTTPVSTGIYTISHLNNTSVICYIDFMNGNTLIGSTQTVSGTISFNLASNATSIRMHSSGGTNLLVTINKTASAISLTQSGTVDILTTSQTYNQTGELYLVVVGGGGGAARTAVRSPQNSAAGGGGSGGVTSTRSIVNTATSVTIGTAGNGGASGDANGNAGGATSFGNISSNGGGGGTFGGYGNNTLFGAAGTPGGGVGGFRNAGNIGGTQGSASVSSSYPFLVKGSTGGGGGAGYLQDSTPGGGSGIGTGGNSSWNNGNGNTGTGYGSGGGAGLAGSAGSGRPGVVYVLRGVTFQ
jgi:hypothetical protein